ncbi:HlyD family type I secretion periplasmic adaptor subunit [Rhodospirillum sp. A1_3_36]|uniref:HlyD family type I secretion periplasmic adaptor subunit n=1 Tax=Rhodospirillum sp. A1_3_36 TaxID=3391666 RepID=UPI0039A67900
MTDGLINRWQGFRRGLERTGALFSRFGHVGKAALEIERAQEKARKAQGKTGGDRSDKAFLPAVLEVTETPPSPMGRTLILVICGAFLTATLWATFGKVDVIASAQGKILPTGRVKEIQPLEPGVVRVIHVVEGQRVAAGAPLVELDAADARADAERMAGELLETDMTIARLNALLADDPAAAFTPPLEAPPEMVDLHRRYMMGEIQDHWATLDSLASAETQAEAEVQVKEAEIARLDKVIPKTQQRVESYRGLVAKQLSGKLDFLELEASLAEYEGERGVLVQQVDQARAAHAAALAEYARAREAFRHDVLKRLSETRRDRFSLARELDKARDRLDKRTLSSPVAGRVQDLAVHTVGGVVTEAQKLMTIVPEDATLEVQALILNKDIGFVEVGQDVTLKVDSFPFTKYGTLNGEVIDVSADAIEDEKMGLVFPARVHMDKTTIQANDKDIRLAPGMTVVAEVKTGKRRVIEYLLAPLQRYQSESIRER